MSYRLIDSLTQTVVAAVVPSDCLLRTARAVRRLQTLAARRNASLTSPRYFVVVL